VVLWIPKGANGRIATLFAFNGCNSQNFRACYSVYISDWLGEEVSNQQRTFLERDLKPIAQATVPAIASTGCKPRYSMFSHEDDLKILSQQDWMMLSCLKL
jgi:hypothetical protein